MVKKKKKRNSAVYGVPILVGVILVVVLILTSGFTNWSAFGVSDKPVLDLYVMSQCPYGVQAENAIVPWIETLNGAVELNIEFIATDNGDGTFGSLHGQPEVLGNIVQLCVESHAPESYYDFLMCQNVNYQNIPYNWEQCASSLELDMDAIATCYEGDEGKDLLAKSIAKSEDFGATGSPTIALNGQAYTGDRNGKNVVGSICSQFDLPECDLVPQCLANSDCNDNPKMIGVCENKVCEYIEPVSVEMIVLTDSKCVFCDSSEIEGYMKGWFKGLSSRYVEASSEEGLALIESMNITYVPAYLFSESLPNTYVWKNELSKQSYFESAGGKYLLTNEAVKSSWMVEGELKQSYLQDLGINTGDNKPQVNFFVMSYCPYGNTAEEELMKVYENLGEVVEWIPQYIFYPGYQGGGPDYCFDSGNQYCSMHGVQEGNQGVRELCVLENYGIGKWFDFTKKMNAACTYKNADACWEAVAQDLSLDTGVISSCENTNAEIYGAAQLDATDLYQASGSPTVFIDGMKYGGDRTANGYQEAICAAFETMPEACGNVLESIPVNAPTSAGSC